MPKALEAKKIHFLQGALRDQRSKAMRYAATKTPYGRCQASNGHKPFLWLLLKKSEELNKLFVLWGRPTTGANIDEAHAECFGALSFGCDRALPFAAEIHDGGDADFLQLLNSLLVRLRAAVEKVVDLAHVGNAVELDFFGKWRPGGMSGSAERAERAHPETRTKEKSRARRCARADFIRRERSIT